MDQELQSMLDRANELLKDLENEYSGCLKARNVTERAKNLSNEVLEKLRHVLDHTMRRAWRQYIEPNLSDPDRQRARVHFPIASDSHSFRSILGRGSMADLDKVHKSLYDFLLKKQLFLSKENRWLDLLAKIAGEGKHVRLTPQKRKENQRIKVSKPGGGSVSWDPSSVKFGAGVSIMGAPVDPRTQRIFPTSGVNEQVEVWVFFIFEDYGVNALVFCKEAYEKTGALIEEMVNVFQLQDAL